MIKCIKCHKAISVCKCPPLRITVLPTPPLREDIPATNFDIGRDENGRIAIQYK